ncbi:hypothetical protein CASFOL_019284 [Castilleja foliolosa]|uniref:Uncharacterized protein n=1 Tax=Castilleja foliolosa TaxID=1961234 RepID=A0ABD3D7T2_9LAMI
MEGGVRQSRASARYASSPSPAPFNGPVRKWKKQWVATPSPIPNNRNAAPSILLRRWTPIPAADAADQPPTRRFRYAPVVPIVKGNKKAPEKVITTSTSNQTNNNGAHMNGDSDGMLGKPSSGYMIPQEEEADEELSEDSNKSDGHGYTSEKRRKTGRAEESEIQG